MKLKMTEVGKLLKIGLCYGVTLTLVACGTDNTTGVDEVEVVEDETAAITTEETGTFGGRAAEVNNALYTDFNTAGFFDTWDTNNDNLLNENEYAVSVFNTWDVNDDSILDENEWETALNDFGFDEDNNWAIAAWDANNDNRITESEFNNKLMDAGLFARLDTNNDGMLDANEYSVGTVNLWNEADDDGILDEEEYRETKNRYFEEEERAYQPERG